jgi:hypothetical protein
VQAADVQHLQRVIEFLDTLEISGELEAASLDPPGPLMKVEGTFSSSLDFSADLRKVIADAALVAGFFGAQIRMPERYYKHDMDNLETLKAMATGEPFFDANFGGSLIKSPAQDRELEILDGSPRSITVDYPAGSNVFSVFDQRIDAGRITFEAESASAIHPERIREAYSSALDGDTVGFNMLCKGPCRFIVGTSVGS